MKPIITLMPGFLILILLTKSIATTNSKIPYTSTKYLPKYFLNIYKNGNINADDVTGRPVYSFTGVLLFLVISRTLKYAKRINAASGYIIINGTKYVHFIPKE